MPAQYTTSPNMNLPIPIPGVTSGALYAQNVTESLRLVDQHDHSSGSGVQISPSGLNINSDLPFLSNNATGLRSTRFTAQGSPLAGVSDIGCLYAAGADLYYNDLNGNQVRITASGAVAGTPGSIANLVSPASATYISADSTFVWQSAASTPAILDAGSLIVRKMSASSPGITIEAPSSLSSGYTLTLPASPPIQTNILSMDASGAMAAAINVDGSSIQLVSNTIAVKDSGIITAKIADANVTRPKLVAVGQQISSSSGSFSTASGSYTDVTNLSASLTTTGRPVVVMLITDNAGSAGYLSVDASGGSSIASANVKVLRGSTTVHESLVQGNFPTSAASGVYLPPGAVNTLDAVAAGTYTYKVQVKKNFGTVTVTNCKLVAFEL
jgi:hypothetical protein